MQIFNFFNHFFKTTNMRAIRSQTYFFHILQTVKAQRQNQSILTGQQRWVRAITKVEHYYLSQKVAKLMHIACYLTLLINTY